MKPPLSIYIHVPFCKSKCFYCDFTSFVMSREEQKRYLSALKEEIKLYKYFYNNFEIKTIFIGGGTPTILEAEEIGEILEEIYKNAHMAASPEITIEANPESVTFTKLKNLKKAGINRISFGIQALDDRLLKRINRIHDVKESINCLYDARLAGFDNINTDIMFALPDQIISDFDKTLDSIIPLKPEHISCYGLILEEGVPLYDEYKNGSLKIPDENDDRCMYKLAVEKLQAGGYVQYEISNFSFPGKECMHNLNYWLRGPYLGFGLSAHSFIGNWRFNNTYDFEAYINNNFKWESTYYINDLESLAEFMFLGLRMTKGINEIEFAEKFQKNLSDVFGNEIKKLIDEKLLKKNGNYIFLTRRGIDISNYVFRQFIIY